MDQYITHITTQLRTPQEVVQPASDTYPYTIVGGMGGSRLAADLIASLYPHYHVWVHTNYGLPRLPDEITSHARYIASSYSGNTEETNDFFAQAHQAGYPCAAITTGGTLAEAARAKKVPWVELPQEGIPPRHALGYSLRACATLMGADDICADCTHTGETLDPTYWRTDGEELAEKLSGRIPVIYTSTRNAALGTIWRVKFNETAKIVAHHTTLPEGNHNSFAGVMYDNREVVTDTHVYLFLHDAMDDPRIKRRLKLTQAYYEQAGKAVATHTIPEADTRLTQTCASLAVADWCALAIARDRGVDPAETAIIEEFKRTL